jgi:hypothetical protein
MNWDAIGAVAETWGAIGVIATLIYLTFQLKQNTNALNSSTYEAYINALNTTLDFNAENAEVLASLLRKEWKELTPEEKIISRTYALRHFNLMEATFLHRRAGSLDEDVFQACTAGFANLMSSSQPLREAWKYDNKLGFTEEFTAFMHERIIGDSTNAN